MWKCHRGQRPPTTRDDRVSRMFLAAAVLVSAAFASPPLHAQSARCAREAGTQSDDGEKPWSRTASAEGQDKAQTLHRRALSAWKNDSVTEASALLRQALDHWQHPSIRVNLAKALLELGRPAEAHEVVSPLFQYSAAILGCERHRNLQDLRARLERRVARLMIECRLSGTTITIDGTIKPDGPCSREFILNPGDHQLVIEKAGHQTRTEDFALVERDTQQVEVTAHVPERPTWVGPVLSVGVLTSAVGSGLWLLANSKEETLQSRLESCPATGCTGEKASEMHSMRRSANRQRRAGWITLAAGGAAVTASAVRWVFYSRRDHELRLQVRPDRNVMITPVLTPATLGLQTTLSF